MSSVNSHELIGKVLTVNGPASPDTLGFTLTHEHIMLNYDVSFQGPPLPQGNLEEADGLGYIRYLPYSHKPNLILNNAHVALEELQHFKEAVLRLNKKGILLEKDEPNWLGCIVENSTVGIRELEVHSASGEEISREGCFKKLSNALDIHIICGTGYYIDATHPKDMSKYSIDYLVQFMENEIITGIGDTGVRCGVIGEIGCSWPLTENEKKTLIAAAKVQVKLGAPLIVHPGRNPRAPIQIIQILKEAGADISRTVMSHLDRTFKFEYSDARSGVSIAEKAVEEEHITLELAKTGCYLEYDLFGIECSFYQFNQAIDMPSDAQRIDVVRMLIKQGYLNRILLAHDIHTKHRLIKYGGHGYSHLLKNIIPKMLQRGITREEIITILVENPKRWLTFVEPKKA